MDRGKFLWVFPRVDGTRIAQEPLNLVIRVAAFRRSGLVGGSIDVKRIQRGRY